MLLHRLLKWIVLGGAVVLVKRIQMKIVQAVGFSDHLPLSLPFLKTVKKNLHCVVLDHKEKCKPNTLHITEMKTEVKYVNSIRYYTFF